MSSTTAQSATPEEILSTALSLIDICDRIQRHGRSEKVPDVEGIMATVTPPDQLTWSRCLAWSLMPGPAGRKIRIRTTPDEIRKFYEWRTSLDVPADSRTAPLTAIHTGWYGFHEAHPTVMHDVATGEVTRVVEALELFTTDGRQGINSEIIWLRMDDVSIDAATRVTRCLDYLDALRGQDSGKIVELMSPNVQGAVRDYVDADPPFIAIHGRGEMRTYYDRMFSRFEVMDVRVLQSRIGEWYVFHELFLTLRARDGESAARRFACRVAEYMPIDEAGAFQGRCGYGTDLLPL